MVAKCIMAAMNNKNARNNERFSIPIALGHDALGNEISVDQERLTHLLIGGVPNPGKGAYCYDISDWSMISYSP